MEGVRARSLPEASGRQAGTCRLGFGLQAKHVEHLSAEASAVEFIEG